MGDVTHVQAPLAPFAVKDLRAKSVSLSYPSNIPDDVYGHDIVDSALRCLGAKKIYVAAFTSSGTNLTVPLEAAHAGKTTLIIMPTGGGTQCSDTYLSLESLGMGEKLRTTTPRDTPTIATTDGGELPREWNYTGTTPVAGAPTPIISVYTRIVTHEGYGSVAHTSWAINAFDEAVTVAKLDTNKLRAHKKITPATVKANAGAYKGAIPGGTSHLDCGAYPAYPAVCNQLVSLFQSTKPAGGANSPGVIRPIVHWIGPPKGFKMTVPSRARAARPL